MPRRSGRRSRPRPAGPPPDRTASIDRVHVVDKHDGQWNVRAITGAASTKPYTCPGCHRPIPMATPHLVVWPVEKALLSADALDERRHWHAGCWSKKP